MEQGKLLLLCLVLLTVTASPLFAAAPGGPGLSPDEALKLLKEGNARYVEGKARHPNQDRERRALTAAQGQKPFAAVLSCSDSRVPVEILFDRGVGDIFVVKVAGNIAATYEIASIEGAVEPLGATVVVVLGHTQCGAITAVVEGDKVHGHVALLVKRIQPAVAKAKAGNPGATGGALVQAAIKANIWQAIEDMLRKSSLIKKQVKAGKIRVVGAIYDLDTGQVQWLGPHPAQDKLVGLAKPANAGTGKKKSKQ